MEFSEGGWWKISRWKSGQWFNWVWETLCYTIGIHDQIDEAELALMMLLMILLRVRSEKSNFKLKYTISVLK